MSGQDDCCLDHFVINSDEISVCAGQFLGKFVIPMETLLLMSLKVYRREEDWLSHTMYHTRKCLILQLIFPPSLILCRHTNIRIVFYVNPPRESFFLWHHLLPLLLVRMLNYIIVDRLLCCFNGFILFSSTTVSQSLKSQYISWAFCRIFWRKLRFFSCPLFTYLLIFYMKWLNNIISLTY